MRSGKGRFRAWTWARRSTAILFLALLFCGTREWFVWFKGSTTATTLFDLVPFVDPLAAIEVMAAARAVEWTLIIGGGLLLFFSLVMGPVFCGWICPLGLLLDLNGGFRSRLIGFFFRKGQKRKVNAIRPTSRYASLGFVLAFSLVAGLPLFQMISPINLVAWCLLFFHSSTSVADPGFWELCAAAAGSVISAGGYLLLLLALIVAVEYALPRIWCRALCPLGAIHGLAGRRGLFRVRLDSEKLDHEPCGQCTANCPMGIDVLAEFAAQKRRSIVHEGCTRCGACVEVCPRRVYHLGFRSQPSD